MPDIKKTLLFFILFIAICRDILSYEPVNGMEDIPLYKDMNYVEDSLVLFDKVEGRYVSSEIIGNYHRDEVVEFYNKTLPNLGWKKISREIFKRSDEILEIKFSEINNKTLVFFSIYPGK